MALSMFLRKGEFIPMKYLALAFTSIKKYLYYRKSVGLTVFFSCFGIYILHLFWKAIYRNDDSMYRYMLTYSIASQIMSTMYFFNLKLSKNIRSGDISIELLRPFNYIAALYFDNIGEVFGKMLTVAIPVLVVSIIFFGFPLIGLSQMIVWFICILLSFLLLFLIKVVIELASFWFVQAWFLEYIVNTLIRLLSGSFLPSFLVMGSLKKAMENLPFIWIYQKPIELYIQGAKQTSVNLGEYTIVWLNQILWILGLGFCVFLLWTAGRKKIMVQGG